MGLPAGAGQERLGACLLQRMTARSPFGIRGIPEAGTYFQRLAYGPAADFPVQPEDGLRQRMALAGTRSGPPKCCPARPSYRSYGSPYELATMPCGASPDMLPSNRHPGESNRR